jgi:hypothetical protein
MAIRETIGHIAQCDDCGAWWNDGRQPWGTTPGEAANIAAEWSTGLGTGMRCVRCRYEVGGGRLAGGRRGGGMW